MVISTAVDKHPDPAAICYGSSGGRRPHHHGRQPSGVSHPRQRDRAAGDDQLGRHAQPDLHARARKLACAEDRLSDAALAERHLHEPLRSLADAHLQRERAALRHEVALRVRQRALADGPDREDQHLLADNRVDRAVVVHDAAAARGSCADLRRLP